MNAIKEYGFGKKLIGRKGIKLSMVSALLLHGVTDNIVIRGNFVDWNINSGLAWLGFWIFLSVLVACDCWLFEKGYNTLFQTHKTNEEKLLLQLKIEERRLNIEILKKAK